MSKYFVVFTLVGAIAIGTSFAHQTTAKLIIPIERTKATDGRQMFTSYCAPCHGTDGRGHGPAAAALKTQPADLTAISKNNHGRYPETHVVMVLRYGAEAPSHKSAGMPVWGPILGNMSRTNIQDKELRICNLNRYLETIQRQ